MKSLLFTTLFTAGFGGLAIADPQAPEFLFDNLESLVSAPSFEFFSIVERSPMGGDLKLYLAPMATGEVNDDSSAMLSFRLQTPAELVEIGASEMTTFHCSQLTTDYPEGWPQARPYELLISHLNVDYLAENQGDYSAFRSCEATLYFQTNASQESLSQDLFDSGNAFMGGYYSKEHFRMDVNGTNLLHSCVMGENISGEARMVTWEIRSGHSVHISIVAPISGAVAPLQPAEFVSKALYSL